MDQYNMNMNFNTYPKATRLPYENSLRPISDEDANEEALQLTKMLVETGHLQEFIEFLKKLDQPTSPTQIAPQPSHSPGLFHQATPVSYAGSLPQAAPNVSINIAATPSTSGAAPAQNRPSTRASLRPPRSGAGRPSGAGGKAYGGSGPNRRTTHSRFWAVVDRVVELMREGENPHFHQFDPATGAQPFSTDKDEYRSAKKHARNILKQGHAQMRQENAIVFPHMPQTPPNREPSTSPEMPDFSLLSAMEESGGYVPPSVMAGSGRYLHQNMDIPSEYGWGGYGSTGDFSMQ